MTGENEIKMVKDADVTFVVQGPIVELTAKVLESISRLFPSSQIILSTWRGQDVSSFSDIPHLNVVKSRDPGAVSDHEAGSKLDNVNRQIVSSKAGLEEVTTGYVVKTRTDIVFTKPNILKLFSKFSGKATWFKEKVLSVNYNFKNPDLIGLVFHPSDLVLMGQTIDIYQLFNVPLRSSSDSQRLSWDDHPPLFFRRIYPSLLTLHTAEAYLLVEFLKKIKPEWQTKKLETCFTDNAEIKKCWKQAIVENYIVVDPFRLGVRFSKYPFREFKSFYSLTHIEWQNLSRIMNGDRTIRFDGERLLYRFVGMVYRVLGKKTLNDY